MTLAHSAPRAHIEGMIEKQSSRVPTRATTPSALGPDEVKAIRYKLKQSQSEFALMIGVTLSTLQGWEEGRHQPDGPAQALLRVAAKNPRIVAKALGRG